MNRADFMNQLESLLTSIAPAEREEAIQYYNDYFDDAGEENEQEVIEALGNPARVAENIKRDLLGNGYGEKTARKAQASDRALMEYGKEESDAEQEPAQDAGSGGGNVRNVQAADAAYGRGGAGGTGGPGRESESSSRGFQQEKANVDQGTARQEWNPFEGYGRSQEPDAGEDAYRWSHDTAGWFGEKPEKEKGKMPVWAVAVLVTVLIFASPVLAGVALTILGVVFGGLAGWFGMILGFGVAAVCLLLVFVTLLITGVICCFVNPWVGMALLGGGLICGCLGLLFLMLTVAMAGIATPAIFRGIGWIFRSLTKKRKKAASA